MCYSEKVRGVYSMSESATVKKNIDTHRDVQVPENT